MTNEHHPASVAREELLTTVVVNELREYMERAANNNPCCTGCSNSWRARLDALDTLTADNAALRAEVETLTAALRTSGDARESAQLRLAETRDRLAAHTAECETLRAMVERVRGCKRIYVYDDDVMMRRGIEEVAPDGKYMRADDILAALTPPTPPTTEHTV